MSRLRPNQRATLWLMPAEPEKDLFNTLIKTLAHELKAPPFPPHLTLFTAQLGLSEARRLLRGLEGEPFSLTIDQVDHSSQFTKTLFLRFRSSKALTRLTTDLQRSLEMPVQPIIDPHLSLCYKKLPASARRELAGFIHLPFHKVRFDRVTLALCGAQTRTAADVKAWRTVSSIALD